MTEFGVIFHWGIYSVPAYDDSVSARRRGVQNGSEWYYKRLLENGSYLRRAVAGWKATHEHHKQNYEGQEYSQFAEPFNEACREWDAKSWIKLVKKSGATYVILTSKHHDGFCLWDTKSTEFRSERNLLKIFVDEARKAGLRVGIYFSWMEFDLRCTKEYMEKVKVQMNELRAYNPDMWWFDGQWECTTLHSNQVISDIVKKLKKDNPNVEINDRLIGSKDKSKYRDNPNFLGQATYRVYGDRAMPAEAPDVSWEHINTIGLSWGYNKSQPATDYKSPQDLKKLFDEVKEKNGKFLINFGPKKDGSLDEREVQSFKGLIKLLKQEKEDEMQEEGENKEDEEGEDEEEL